MTSPATARSRPRRTGGGGSTADPPPPRRSGGRGGGWRVRGSGGSSPRIGYGDCGDCFRWHERTARPRAVAPGCPAFPPERHRPPSRRPATPGSPCVSLLPELEAARPVARQEHPTPHRVTTRSRTGDRTVMLTPSAVPVRRLFLLRNRPPVDRRRRTPPRFPVRRTEYGPGVVSEIPARCICTVSGIPPGTGSGAVGRPRPRPRASPWTLSWMSTAGRTRDTGSPACGRSGRTGRLSSGSSTATTRPACSPRTPNASGTGQRDGERVQAPRERRAMTRSLPELDGESPGSRGVACEEYGT